MTPLGNSIIGLAFIAIAAFLTFLMFYIWKFPIDHEKKKSTAPLVLVRTHRILGVVYVAIYIFLMWQMVPRLWEYQIELPARTVTHLTLGISIGALLVAKLTIVRFFKHMEAKLVPFLGVALFICTFLLVSLALPFSLREVYLQNTALGKDTMTEERVARVREQLPNTGLEDEKLLAKLTTREGLTNGRRILQAKCVQCHDLRTVLARPRTPQNWQQTVERMANRSTILNPITQEDQWYVTAYLIAVSPTLQETLRQRRKVEMASVESQKSMVSATKMVADAERDSQYDTNEARTIFEKTCSQCHSFTQVENEPPANKDAAIALVQRMVRNGLAASEEDLNTVIRYLTETYASASEPAPKNTVSKDLDEPRNTTETVAVTSAGIGGEALYSQKGCITCHGPAGKAPIGPNYPRLASQNKNYLIQQIQDIKSGMRNNGMSSVMSSIVQSVSDDEIEAIAAYLSTVK
jgi:cytochrome c553